MLTLRADSYSLVTKQVCRRVGILFQELRSLLTIPVAGMLVINYPLLASVSPSVGGSCGAWTWICKPHFCFACSSLLVIANREGGQREAARLKGKEGTFLSCLPLLHVSITPTMLLNLSRNNSLLSQQLLGLVLPKPRETSTYWPGPHPTPRGLSFSSAELLF